MELPIRLANDVEENVVPSAVFGGLATDGGPSALRFGNDNGAS